MWLIKSHNAKPHSTCNRGYEARKIGHLQTTDAWGENTYGYGILHRTNCPDLECLETYPGREDLGSPCSCTLLWMIFFCNVGYYVFGFGLIIIALEHLDERITST